jgi:hypothetical protein
VLTVEHDTASFQKKKRYSKPGVVLDNRAKKQPLKLWINIRNGSLEKECVEYI